MLKVVENNSALAFLAPRRYIAGINSAVMDSIYAQQNNTNWCWAACIEMIAKYHGINVSQEYFASQFCGVNSYGRIKDCPAPVDIITEKLNWCAYRGWIREKSHCIKTSVHYGNPSVDNVIRLLKANKPVIVAYKNRNSDVGHAVLITSVSFDVSVFGNELNHIIVRDPAVGKLIYRNPAGFLSRIYAWWVPTVTKY